MIFLAMDNMKVKTAERSLAGSTIGVLECR
jgi:hypothetical protein